MRATSSPRVTAYALLKPGCSKSCTTALITMASSCRLVPRTTHTSNVSRGARRGAHWCVRPLLKAFKSD
eukprot:3959474-Pyramimonas_sp.AAC.1